MENNWRNKTLENLEKDKWPDINEKTSRLVARCHELRKIPVGDLTVEDLRLMIGQQIGLSYLVPLAIEKLKEDILSEGDYYPGDLLKSVLNIEIDFWKENKPLWGMIDSIVELNKQEIEEASISIELFKSV